MSVHSKLIWVFLLFTLLAQTPAVAADTDKFSVTLNSRYTFTATGSSQVRQEFSVVNLTSESLISGYELIFPGQFPSDLNGVDDKGKLVFQTEKIPSGTRVRAIFNSVAAGKDAVKNFTLFFSGPQAFRHDNVWELSIPPLSKTDAVSAYTLEISIPSDFGLLAYSSLYTNPQEIDPVSGNSLYRFSDPRAVLSGLSAVFGDFQTWGFRLDYQLPGDKSKPSEFRILLPPDSIGQKISFDSLTPMPVNIEVTDPGNWVALYRLKPGQNQQVTVTGQIRLVSSPSPLSSLPSPSIISFSSPGIVPSENYVRPYHSEIFYDLYAASFPKISLNWQPPQQIFPGIFIGSGLEITNSGNVAAYSLPLTVTTLGLVTDSQSLTIPVIPPFSTYRLPIKISFPLTSLFSPKQIIFTAGTSSITYNVPAEKLYATYGLIVFTGTVSLFATAIAAYRAGSIHLQKLGRKGHLHR